MNPYLKIETFHILESLGSYVFIVNLSPNPCPSVKSVVKLSLLKSKMSE